MSVYRIFEKQSIDTQQLIQISKILERDFFNEISEELNIACNNSKTEL